MTNQPLHVTHVFVPGPAGGLERVVEMLAAGQVQRGHGVSAIAVRPASAPESPVVARMVRHGVDVVAMPVSGRAYSAERRAFAELLGDRPPGVVHTHGYRADVVYAPVAARLGFPVVTTLHGFTGGDIKNRLYEFLQRRSCRRFDRVVAVSTPIARLMRRAGVADDRLRVIQNAYRELAVPEPRATARQRLELDESALVLGWVGRMSREKGADVFLESLAELRDLNVQAAFVGDGPELPALRARAMELGVDRHVRWCGSVQGMGELFAAFDAFVLSSRTEGTPIVLFEAMAARIPVVATSVGGVPDVVTAADALLVPPESPSLLAAAIRRVAENGPESRARAAHAHETLRQRFSLEPWLDRYDEVYRAALQARRRS